MPVGADEVVELVVLRCSLADEDRRSVPDWEGPPASRANVADIAIERQATMAVRADQKRVENDQSSKGRQTSNDTGPTLVA